MISVHGSRKRIVSIFAITFALALGILSISLVKNARYNSATHHETFTGTALFSEDGPRAKGVSVVAVPRGSTWTKVFDLEDEGLTEHNYQAFTYDFTIANNTRDEVSDFSFRLTFSHGVFLSSAWNGSLEIHQHTDGGERVDTIPDLREFAPDKHDLNTMTFDGENLVALQAGDYLVYHPSTSVNAMEMPIEPMEATTPGIIMYVRIGDDISDSELDLEYSLHRSLSHEPLFWVAMVGMGIWAVALVVVVIISAQIHKYTVRHERDNEIIRESIETFTGFIDAKDPYTNGHSKRVAQYTRQIAAEMGYTGEELDRIYYIALLHDCGKIGVPDGILGKPGRLTDEEFEIIKSHTVRGGEILSSFRSLKGVEEGARYHHERYDGRGYPEGKAGEDIPLIARMICVADSFDAMNTNRVYRRRLTREDIIREIEDNLGKQFDPDIADIMLRLLRDGEIVIDG